MAVEDDWGRRDLFRKLFLLAAECRDDAAVPMHDVVICLKDAPDETAAEIGLSPGAGRAPEPARRPLHWRGGARAQLVEVCEGWARSLIESGIEPESTAESTTGSTPGSAAATGA